jgi:signal transduction histidine kinase
MGDTDTVGLRLSATGTWAAVNRHNVFPRCGWVQLRLREIGGNGQSMLREFILANRELIIERARQRVYKRMPAASNEAQLEHGIPIFLTQLVGALAKLASSGGLHLVSDPQQAIDASAALHGRELLRNGFTVGQVVHGYGDVCQVVTELAVETNATFSAADFHVFNLCLDDAIAGAVTAFGQHRENDLAHENAERKGVLAHELRNLLNAATLSFDVIRRGAVGVGGSTAAVHARSLAGLNTLVERALAEVRLEAGTPKLQRLVLAEFIEEVELVAQMQAQGFGLKLLVSPVDGDLAVDADRQLLGSAVSNLLQNAFKFTRPQGEISLVTHATADRVLIEIQDECGGIPDGKAEELFHPFTQAGADRSGLGLGLSIALAAVRINSGQITVSNTPGTGCVFTVVLPRKPPPPASTLRVAPQGDRGAVEGSDGQSVGSCPP